MNKSITEENSVTIILNIYKRAQHLEEQFDSLINQTMKPQKIIIWNNGCKEDFTKYKENKDVLFFDSNYNFGVWSRFFISLVATTKYVCVFDDDTIPGNKWIENCINTMEIVKNGVLGTCGMIFKPGNEYDHIKRVGWVNPNEEIHEVDAVCHSWFFKRETFIAYLSDLPNTEIYKTFGEDMHLSHSHQKIKKIKTYVPPHPKNNKELWGSDFDKGWKYGTETCAISVSMPFKNFTIPFKRLIELGFETISNKDIFLKDYNWSIDFFINKINKLEPFALIRFSDKEHFVLENLPIKTIDEWSFNKNSILIEHLNNVLKLNNSNVYFGIHHKCDNMIMFNYYKKKLSGNSNLTFSTIFCNANYEKFLNFVMTSNLDIVLISCNKPFSNKIGSMSVIDYLEIDKNLTSKWDYECENYINKAINLSLNYTKKIFLLSGGPIAKILIQRMYEANPNNIYVDVGSSIDSFTKNMITRDFHKLNSNMNKHICSF